MSLAIIGLALGALFGYIFRKTNIHQRFSKLLLPTSVLLLFFMGINLGGTPDAGSQAGRITLSAAAIAISSIAGSIAMVKMFRTREAGEQA